MFAGWRRWTSRPPRVDARQLERYSPTVLAKYRGVTLRFTTWLHFLRVLPSATEDWNDAVGEYLDAVDLSFEDLEVRRAPVKLLLPRSKTSFPLDVMLLAEGWLRE